MMHFKDVAIESSAKIMFTLNMMMIIINTSLDVP